jgi:hypothetical protein
MSRLVHTIEIDRIVLTDLGITSERAERIRTLVEVELQHLLAREGMVDGLAGSDVPDLQVSTLHLPGHNNDRRLAGGLARSITQALRGGG